MIAGWTFQKRTLKKFSRKRMMPLRCRMLRSPNKGRGCRGRSCHLAEVTTKITRWRLNWVLIYHDMLRGRHGNCRDGSVAGGRHRSDGGHVYGDDAVLSHHEFFGNLPQFFLLLNDPLEQFGMLGLQLLVHLHLERGHEYLSP